MKQVFLTFLFLLSTQLSFGQGFEVGTENYIDHKINKNTSLHIQFVVNEDNELTDIASYLFNRAKTGKEQLVGFVNQPLSEQKEHTSVKEFIYQTCIESVYCNCAVIHNVLFRNIDDRNVNPEPNITFGFHYEGCPNIGQTTKSASLLKVHFGRTETRFRDDKMHTGICNNRVEREPTKLLRVSKYRENHITHITFYFEDNSRLEYVIDDRKVSELEEKDNYGWRTFDSKVIKENSIGGMVHVGYIKNISDNEMVTFSVPYEIGDH